jgi:ribonuclease G
MANLLLVSVAAGDTRVALSEDGRLAEFFLEHHSQADPTGNIYKGRVVKVLPGMAAAFVEIGLERPAYLFVDEVGEQGDELYSFWLKQAGEEGPPPDTPPRRALPAAIEELLREGQDILVQVTRPPQGDKGARLTAHVTLPGHYLVLSPTLPHLGVSRRIPHEDERERLRGLLSDLRPDNMGLIARTAAQGQPREKLLTEQEELLQLWREIRRKSRGAPPPALLHRELGAAFRVMRDLFTPEVDRVVTDHPAAYERLLQYVTGLNPLWAYKVELYQDPEPLFSHFALEIDLARMLSPLVWLKSGGYLWFETTEALTAIDVNTGRFVGRHHLEDTLLKTDLEAARETARQLRLRNLGGIIVIDFIDLAAAAHRDQVYQELLESLKRDRAKTTVMPMSPLGLVEMTRQRLRESLAQTVTEPCRHCDGRGFVLTPLTLAHELLRQLAAEAREFPGSLISVQAHPEVLAALHQEAASLKDHWAQSWQVQIELTPNPSFPREHYEITREWPTGG